MTETERRQFLIRSIALALFAGARVEARQRTNRMAYLGPASATAGAHLLKALFGRLEELGYRAGRNLVRFQSCLSAFRTRWPRESSRASAVRAPTLLAFANGNRLPAAYGLHEFTEAGGLMSHSFSFIEHFRAAATYLDKILRGAKPSDLPVEQPTRFERVLNLKTAKALGVKFPPAILPHADRVIE